jgi:hypothetical protein
MEGKSIINLPLLPPSLNKYGRMHWRKQRNEKKVWNDYLFIVWLKLKRPVYQQVIITLIFTFPDCKQRDLDNYLATGSKLTGDAVKGLFIPDDIPKYLAGWKFLFQHGTAPQTTIIIEEADNLECSVQSCAGGL